MTPIRTDLCWAAAFLTLALANFVGLITDRDAATMFAILPALWVVTRGRDCLSRSHREV